MIIKSIFCLYRISDALFSITIHPLLIAVNLGSDVHELFGKAGTYYTFPTRLYHTSKDCNFVVSLIGCDWYAFGAVFFGSFSMCLHASVSFTRYKIIVCSGEREFWFCLLQKMYLEYNFSMFL